MIVFPLDNTEYKAEALGAWFCTRTRGVFSSDNHFQVKATGAMNVTVGTGLAWLKIDEFWGICMVEKEEKILTIPTAHGAYGRYDAVCIRMDKNMNLGTIVIKTGVPSIHPTIPEPTRNNDFDEIYIATVLVPAGATKITTDLIMDQRLNETYCGVMRDGVTQIPTQQLYEAWLSWFDRYKDSGNSQFDLWFQKFSKEKEENFLRWLEGIGDQMQEGLRENLLAFAIEGKDLILYYSQGINPHSFIIENGSLYYTLDSDV